MRANRVVNEKEFQQGIQRIGDLVGQIDQLGDPALRARMKDLVQLLMEMHGAGLERIMDLVFQSGEHGPAVIDQLGRDPLVSSLLVLYGLHPDDVETRVARAVERVRPQIKKHGGDIELLSLDGSGARLRVQVGEHSCGSTSKTIKSLVEDAIYGAAPDVASVSIEGLEDKTGSGFVAVGALLGSSLASPAFPAPAPRANGAD